MEVENQISSNCDGYADWRGKPASRNKHGGMLAASFVLVVEVMENLAYLANASNLVLYLTQYMHFSPSESANTVTDFMGTAFLLALVGGFLADAYFTTYHIYIMSALIEFLGLVILTVQAQSSSLKPPKCDGSPCHKVDGAKAAMLFLGLYLVALGVGGIKGSLPTHGAEQFDETTPQGRKHRSSFFNYFVFSLSCGGLIAVTLVVWIEDNKGWQWGFGISTLTILLSIPVFLSGSRFYRNKIPVGSPLTTISKVVLACLLNTCKRRSSSNAVVNMTMSPSPTSPHSNNNSNHNKPPQSPQIDDQIHPSQSLKFLNKAIPSSPSSTTLKCTIQEVEQVKIILKILPMFASTIMLNSCLAQLSTFSVQQAATMDTKLGSLKVPPASLPVFPVVFIMILAPLYNHTIIPFARKITKSESGITHLQRIGIGLVLSVVAMAVAALVEIKRKQVATRSTSSPLPITFLWIALQYLFLGSADLFTLAGLLEFFFTEAPFEMRSLATALTWASLAMGYYLSSVIVDVVNRVTGDYGHRAWLSGSNINDYRLDRFYWVMCVLSGLNFLHFLFWANRYSYRSNK